MKEIKLYDLPRGAKIYNECSDGSAYLTFNNLDGMYSHCTTEKGGTIHLMAGTPLIEHEDGYKIAE